MAEPVRIMGGKIGGKSNEGLQAQVNQHGSLHTTQGSINATNKTYEDVSFVTGESPATHDFNDDAGRNAVDGYIVCDGDGNIQVDISRDGLNYDAKWTMKSGEVVDLQGLDIDKIRITWTANSSYRVNLI